MTRGGYLGFRRPSPFEAADLDRLHLVVIREARHCALRRCEEGRRNFSGPVDFPKSVDMLPKTPLLIAQKIANMVRANAMGLD